MLLDLARRPFSLNALCDWAQVDAPTGQAAEGLLRLCHSADNDAELTLVGRLALFDRLVAALHHRQRLAVLPTPPPLARPPLLTVGMPRSGTTLLHRLIASHPATAALPTWLTLMPLPGSGADDRRAVIADRLARIARAVPALRAKHPVGADAPGECLPLLEPSFNSITFWQVWPLHSYAEWSATADPAPAYAIYADLIRHLGAATPDRTLVLKGPAHALHLGALTAALPEARIVCTHRDPERVLASLDDLYDAVHRVNTRRPQRERTAAFNRAQLIASLDAIEPAAADLHLRFDDIQAHPAAAAQRVFAAMSLTDHSPTSDLEPRDPARHVGVTLSTDERAVVERYRARFLVAP